MKFTINVLDLYLLQLQISGKNESYSEVNLTRAQLSNVYLSTVHAALPFNCRNYRKCNYNTDNWTAEIQLLLKIKDFCKGSTHCIYVS
jgi:hypothetical protein